MRWMLLCVLVTGGCATVGSLDRASSRHLRTAEKYAARGDGDRAAREQEKATSYREYAREKAGRGGAFQSGMLVH